MDKTRTEKSDVEKDPKAIDESRDIKMEVEPGKDLMCEQPFRNDAMVESQDHAVEMMMMSNMEKEVTEMLKNVEKKMVEVSKRNMEMMETMRRKLQECKEKNEIFEKMLKEFQNFTLNP